MNKLAELRIWIQEQLENMTYQRVADNNYGKGRQHQRKETGCPLRTSAIRSEYQLRSSYPTEE